jgi:beta-galactosidase
MRKQRIRHSRKIITSLFLSAFFLIRCCSPVFAAEEIARKLYPTRELIVNGGFESPADETGEVPFWTLRGDAEIATEGGNSCLRLRNHGSPASSSCGQEFALRPEWKTLEISLRARVARIFPGLEGWHNARVAFTFKNAAGEVWHRCFPEWNEAAPQWQEYKGTMDIPAGAETAVVAPAIFASDGEAYFDNISIIANSTVADDGKYSPIVAPPASVATLPQWGTEPVEKISDARACICLNGLWQFLPGTVPATSESWGEIRVPGSWRAYGVMPGVSKRNDNWNVSVGDQDQAWFRRTLAIPADWKDRSVVLHLDRVSTDALAFIGGREAGWIHWPGGELDITSFVKAGESARLDLFVLAATKLSEITRYMGTGEGQVFQEKAVVRSKGLIGDVLLESRPRGIHVKDILISTSTRNKSLSIETALSGAPGGAVTASARIRDAAGNVVLEFDSTRTAEQSADGCKLRFVQTWDNPHLWDVDDPYLYTLELTLKGEALSDSVSQSFGFREFWTEGRNFYLNGIPIRLRTAPTHEYGGILGLRNLIAANLAGLKACGFNCAEIWPDDRYTRGLIEFDNLWCEEADRLGMLLIVPVTDIGHSIMKLERPRVAAFWESQARERIKPLRNHPSVVIWTLGANRFGFGQDQNPAVIGSREKMLNLEPGTSQRAASGFIAMDRLKSFDPTRPVFMHAGAFVGDVYTINNYLCLLPLQEREDWPSHWAERGDMPLVSIEFGSPLYTTFLRGRNGYGKTCVSEPLVTEYAATYFGAEAYVRESQDYRKLISSHFESGQQYQSYHLQANDMMKEENAALLHALFNRNTYRSWRAWGVTGGMVPWGMHGWNRPRSSWQGGSMADAKPFQPGQRGLYLEKYPVEYLQSYLPENFRQPGNAGAMALVETNRQTLSFLGGKPHEFTEKGHSFFAGETVAKQVVLLNDTRAEQTFSWTVQVKIGNDLLAERAGSGRFEPAGTRFVPFDFTLPQVTAKTSGVIEVMTKIGETESRDSFPFRVFPQLPVATQTVCVLDPVGETTGFLQSLGYTVKLWNGEKETRVVIGRKALAYDSSCLAKLEQFVQEGGEILVMAQEPEWLRTRLQWRVSRHLSRRMFPVPGTGGLLGGVDAEDLRDWRGESKLISPCDVAVPNGRYDRSPEYGWRWGAKGTVSSCAVEKPHFSSWTPLLEGEFDLAYSPLMGFRYGAGTVIFCGLDLEDHAADPVAREILPQLLTLDSTGILARKVETVFLGAPEDEVVLKNVGAIYTVAETLPAPGGLALIGAGAKLDDAALTAWLEKGGIALFLPTQAAKTLPLGATVDRNDAFTGATEVPEWDLCQGLSVSDLHGRCERTAYLLTGGCDISAAGLLGRKKIGEGLAVYCQFDTALAEADTKTYLRFTRWRQNRAFCQVLSNLGASFKSDCFFFKPRAPGENRIALAGVWRGIQTLRLPEAQETSKWNDEGPSEVALAAVRPEAAEQDFASVTLPSPWEDFGGSWLGADGEAVFRKVVRIPAAWEGKELRLSLGPVDDFDTTYFNGVKIGSTDAGTPNFWSKPRVYTIPAELVKQGRAVLAVRVFDHFGGGGICGKDSDMFLEPAAAGQSTASAWYHDDYRVDFGLGDDPYRYYRW